MASLNITTTLVSNALGISSKDVGTLCSSSNINKWSLKKPVIDTSYNNSYWYRGDDGMCGISIEGTYFYHIDLLMAKTNVLSIVNKDWQYNKPTGGSSQPYRLGHFRDYEHSAGCPFEYPSIYEIDTFYNNGSNFIFCVNLQNNDNGNISIYEMQGFDFENCYLVAVVFNKNSETWINTSVADFSMGYMTMADGANIASNLSFINNNDYDVYLLIQNSVTNTYYPLPNSPSFNPTTLTKFYGQHLNYSNIQISYNYDGIFKDFDDVNMVTTNTPFTLVTANGKLFFKFRVTNTTNFNYTFLKSDLSIEGSSINSHYYVDSNLIMGNGGDAIESVVISPNSYVDLTIRTYNPVLFYVGQNNYPAPSNYNEMGCELYLKHLTGFIINGYIVSKSTPNLGGSWA